MTAAGSTVAGTTAAAAGATGLAFTGVNVGWEIIAAAVCLGVGGAIWRLLPRRTA